MVSKFRLTSGDAKKRSQSFKIGCDKHVFHNMEWNFKSITSNASVEQKIVRITCVESLNQRIRITVSVLIGFSGCNVGFFGGVHEVLMILVSPNKYGPPEISDGT